MPATIISSSAFASGSLVLLSHNATVASDGLVQVQMQFACLGTPQVVATNMRRFLPDSPPPVALPTDVAALRLETGTVYLTEARPTTSNGICYIDATYSGSSADQARRVTETWTTRSFSGTILGELVVGGLKVPTIYGSVSFDYTGVSRSVSWTVIGAQGDVSLDAEPVNIRNRNETSLGTPSVVKRGKGFMVQKVPSISTDKVGRVTRITKTVTGEYVSDNDGYNLLREDRRDFEVDLGPLLVG
jgi:hypothetical protein